MSAQAEARIDFGRDDKLFMALPAFHSFGFMGGIVLPLISGVPTYFYPSPLHYRTVPELVYGICATYMFGTDTFLAGYARMANAYDFRSLRYIIAGAEPIKESTRRDLSGKVRPAHSRRLRRHRDLAGARAQYADVQQVRHRRPAAARHGGAAGDGRRASTTAAGCSSRARTSCSAICAPTSPACSSRRTRAGTTPAISSAIDEQGYIAIKGRAKRFAKVGGEMVSLAAVEMLAGELWPNGGIRGGRGARRPQGRTARSWSPTSTAPRVPNSRPSRASKHASELMLPAEVIVLDKLPMLGSGKPDLQSLQALVNDRVAAKTAAE